MLGAHSNSWLVLSDRGEVSFHFGQAKVGNSQASLRGYLWGSRLNIRRSKAVGRFIKQFKKMWGTN